MFNVLSEIIGRLICFILYFENTGSFPKPLKASEELAYFINFKEKGDLSSREKLIEHNLRLVAHIIKKYYTNTNDQDDLLSIGTIGLIKAVNTFAYKKGTRFATYASKCIENEILMYFRNIKKSAQDVYISDPIDSDGEGNAITFSDIISEEFDIIESIDNENQIIKLKEYINTELSKREKEIIELRYGLNGKKALTQREVAKILDISRSYVSRIEKKALDRLKEKFQKEK
jgi:RNA polymerase sporulation-specific sigma factor